MKAMKTTVGKKPMMKAKKGRTVSKVVDQEGNIIKTRTNENTGRRVTVVKYKDKDSSGKRRERTVTPGLTRFEKKANEMYQANPKAAEEDNFKPFTPKAKYGKTVKSKSAKPKAMYGMTTKPTMMKKGGTKKK
jgi:hypothetical protein